MKTISKKVIDNAEHIVHEWVNESNGSLQVGNKARAMFLENEVKLLSEVKHHHLIELHEVLESTQVSDDALEQIVRWPTEDEGETRYLSRISIWLSNYAKAENWVDMFRRTVHYLNQQSNR